jgi:hypothetical protein
LIVVLPLLINPRMRSKSTLLAALLLSVAPALASADPHTTAHAPSPPSDPTADKRALAETLLTADGTRESETKALQRLTGLLSAQVVGKLQISDPAVVAKVTQIVHEVTAPAGPRVVDAAADAYAANFSAKELAALIAFVRSPIGQAEMANQPLLKVELAAVINGSPDSGHVEAAAKQAFAAASLSDRELVERILAAQDFEARTRNDFEALQAAVNAAFAPVLLAAKKAPSDVEKRAEQAEAGRRTDDYVRSAVTVEKGFYVKHYSNAQLAELATYIESEPGRVALNRSPLIKRAVSEVATQQMSTAISLLVEPVCAAVACSSAQRTSVVEWANAMRAASPLRLW